MNSLDKLLTSYTKFIVSSNKFLERIMQKLLEQKKLILFDDSDENDKNVINISKIFIGTQEQVKKSKYDAKYARKWKQQRQILFYTRI